MSLVALEIVVPPACKELNLALCYIIYENKCSVRQDHFCGCIAVFSRLIYLANSASIPFGYANTGKMGVTFSICR